MNQPPCPVHETRTQLKETLRSGCLKTPRIRRIAEEIDELLADIAWGRAGEAHLPAIQSLVATLLNASDDLDGMSLGHRLATDLDTHGEVFTSHVLTHNCASGDCVKLAPAPCQMTCPAGIDVPTYVSLIALGRDAEAIDIIRRDNPFPWVCGLVCTRPCELMCVRGRIDRPVAIKALKAFAAERAMSEGRYRNPEKAPANHHKVCIIGAGPGGMSAAYYLALKGYTVRIIEALPMAGGMIMVGIPRYRLPREVIDREVAMLEYLGVEFRFNTRFGRDITQEALHQEGFKALLLAIGAHDAFTLKIAGEDAFAGVIGAVRLLRQVALGHRHPPGRQVVVVGGGNVAIDAARTCLRLGCPSVTLAYRRTRHEMPADIEEVAQAEEEGVRFEMLTIPREVVGETGRVTGLKCLRAKLVQREGESRRSPQPVAGSDFILRADVIISAIGQRIDRNGLTGLSGLKWTRRDTVAVNMVTMETDVPGIFAAGDAVTGPATVIEAIGGGKRAAEAIDRALCGIPQPKMPPVPVRRGRLPVLEMPASTKMALKRPEMPLLGIDRRRITFQQAELGFTENMVREEARRCLRCDICRRCGQCVTICRENMGIDALRMGYLDFDRPGVSDFRLTGERCIACGACAENCPNGAMVIADRDNERVLSLCGTVLNRQELVTCAACGKVLGPAKYLDYVKDRSGLIQRGDHLLCDRCSRMEKARFSVDNMPI